MQYTIMCGSVDSTMFMHDCPKSQKKNVECVKKLLKRALFAIIYVPDQSYFKKSQNATILFLITTKLEKCLKKY